MGPQLRRQTRERREYLYRKSLEDKDRQVYEKKKRIREALASGKAIPTELRDDEEALRREMDLDSKDTGTLLLFIYSPADELAFLPAPSTHIDDEYNRAGAVDPKIMITTSRDPSSRLTQFAKVQGSAAFVLLIVFFLSLSLFSGDATRLSQLAKNQPRQLRDQRHCRCVPCQQRDRPDHLSRTSRRARRHGGLAFPVRPYRVLFSAQRRPATRH